MKKLFMSMAALSMLLVACQKDDTNNNKGVEKIKVTANLSQGEKTKVDVDPDGLGVYWTSGDAVSVFGELKTGSSFTGQLTTNITSKSKTAPFEGSVNETMDNNYYILYPYDNLHEPSDGTSIDLNLENIYCENPNDNTYLSRYMYMVSKEPGHLNADNKMEFTMEHLTALLQFNIEMVPSGSYLLRNMCVLGDNIMTGGTYNIYKKTVSTYRSPEGVNLRFGQPIDFQVGFITVYMPILPVKAGAVTVRVTVLDQSNGSIRDIDYPVTINGFEAGKRYTKNLLIEIR